MDTVIDAMRNNVFDYFIEREDRARGRGRWFIDALMLPSGFQLFVGRVSIIIEPLFMRGLWGWMYGRVTTAS
jgi:hypothetical protein